MEVEEESAVEDLRGKATSPEPSCVSMKSHGSMFAPPQFSNGTETPDPSLQRDEPIHSRCGLCNQVVRAPISISCGHSFCKQCISLNLKQSSCSGDFECPQCRKSICDAVHCYTADVDEVKERHKTSMKNKYESLFEGLNHHDNQILLNRIYTQLYIIEGENEHVKEEHEVLQIEKNDKTPHNTPIDCNDIFKHLILPKHEGKRKKRENIKTVVTKGIAGIGKTVSVQKFILDWAEGKANQDVDFMFVLPFRELNLMKDAQCLHKLVLDFHPELKHLDITIYDECKVVFIFDGLDESRITLKFSDPEKVSDVNKMSSLGLLMSSLIKGELLPKAHIWITSRPAAANQIPFKYINRVTEIQGFNDAQKEEYFRKRIRDEHQASRIISHIRRARSLHII